MVTGHGRIHIYTRDRAGLVDRDWLGFGRIALGHLVRVLGRVRIKGGLALGATESHRTTIKD